MNIRVTIWLVAGLLACLGAWTLPWCDWGLPHFAIHMIRHMTLVAIAAPCLVLGLPTLSRQLPAAPLIASFVEFIVVWSWHIPAAHELAASSIFWLALEQASFLVVGFLLWSSVLDPRLALAGAGALLLTSMHMTLLGALFVLSQQPLFSVTTSGTTALEAQQMGGMIMLLIGTPVYLVAGLRRTVVALHAVAANQNITPR